MPLTINVAQDTLFDKRVDLHLKSVGTEAKNIRAHSAFSAFFLRMFGNILDVEDVDGNIFHLNKSDFLDFKARNHIQLEEFDTAIMNSNNQSFVENVIKNIKPKKLAEFEESKMRANISKPVQKKVDDESLFRAIAKLNNMSQNEVHKMRITAITSSGGNQDTPIMKVLNKLQLLKDNPLDIPVEPNFFNDCDPNYESLDFINSFKN